SFLRDKPQSPGHVWISELIAYFGRLIAGQEDAASFFVLPQLLRGFHPIVVDDFRNTIAMFGIVDGRCKEVFPWNFAEPLVRLAPAVHCSGDRNAMDAVMRHLFESFAGKVLRREFLRSPATGIQPIKLSCFSVPVDE